MKIFFDGEPFTPSESVDGKKELLDEIETYLNREGKVYTKITVDGIELDRRAFLRLRGGMEARFETCKIQSLVEDSLLEGIAYIERLSDAVEKLAGEFERREIEKAQNNLASFAEGMSWIVNVMYKSQQILGVEDDVLGGNSIAANELNSTLIDISNCVVDGRNTEIGLLLRQKVSPAIREFKTHFKKLLEYAGKNSQ